MRTKCKPVYAKKATCLIQLNMGNLMLFSQSLIVDVSQAFPGLLVPRVSATIHAFSRQDFGQSKAVL